MSLVDGEVLDYCSYWVNTLAQEIRRSGVRCRDKDFVFPAMRSLRDVLGERGVDGFFDEGYVAGYGLSLDGCVEHTERMRDFRESYLESADCWECVDG